jgi:hypothetical protein
MSKFKDELRRVSQVGLQPMGFRAAPAVPPKPGMLLVAILAETDIDHLAERVAGANAGLLSIARLSSGAKTVQKICQAMPGIPWGGWLRESDKEGTKPIVEAGCDFVVFPAASTSLAILQNDEVGKILEVEPGLEPSLLRTINDLPADAVLTSGEQEKGYFLTWHHLMLFRRCAELLTKPLLVSVPSDVAANELQALWEAGVVGVVVETQPQGRIAELRQIIDKMTFPPPRQRRKIEPLLPRIAEEKETVPEEEEE